MHLLEFEMIEVLETLLRGFISLTVLFLVTKMLGKKQISELSLFDYVIGISIGNFTAEITTNMDAKFINGIVAVILFGFVSMSISWVTLKSIKLRRFFIGIPTVLIQHGVLLQKGLQIAKIDINDLLEECRLGGYYDISEIEFAVMEANGKVSILPKGEHKPVTIKDLHLKKEKQGLCASVIIDGKIMTQNLYQINKTKTWLDKQMKQRKEKYKNILLGTVDLNGKLTLYHRNIHKKALNVLE